MKWTSLLSLITSGVVFAFGLFHTDAARAAELQADTLTAWNRYIQAENKRVEERSQSKSFLWSDEIPNRNRRLLAGEILVEPINENIPQNVPHGLIHHW